MKYNKRCLTTFEHPYGGSMGGLGTKVWGMYFTTTPPYICPKYISSVSDRSPSNYLAVTKGYKS